MKAFIIAFVVLLVSQAHTAHADFRESLEVLGIPDDPYFYGTQGNDQSDLCHGHLTRAISKAGDVIAFQSRANNLVEDDNNNQIDVFVKDLATGSIERISVNDDTTEADGDSICPSISADGKFVTYQSKASSLRNGELAVGTFSVFLKDLNTGVTQLVSKTYSGMAAHGAEATISNDGRWILFKSNSNQITRNNNSPYGGIYLYDTLTGDYSLVTSTYSGENANGYSSQPFLSGDGRHAVFLSSASNLVRDDVNHAQDVFWKNLKSGHLMRVNATRVGRVLAGRSRYVSVSDDGQMVAFDTSASGLVPIDKDSSEDVYVKNVLTGAIRLLSVDASGKKQRGNSYKPLIDSSGHSVAFISSGKLTEFEPSDTEVANSNDLYISNIADRSIRRIKAIRDGTFDARISQLTWRDWNMIAFSAPSTPGSQFNAAYDVFVEDLDSGITRTVSEAASPVPVRTGSSYNPSISDDGSIVVFFSASTNIGNQVSGGSGIVWRDVESETNNAVEPAVADTRVTGHRISGGGTSLIYVLKELRSSSPDSSHNLSNLFHYDLLKHESMQLTLPLEGTGIAGGGIRSPQASNNGESVLFRARANNLVSSPSPGWNTFAVDASTKEIRLIEGPAGRLTEVDFSASGRFVAYEAPYFLRQGQAGIAIDDIQTGERLIESPSHASLADGFAISKVRIADEGELLLFRASALPDNVANEPVRFSVYIHDRASGGTERIRLPFPDYDETLERSPALMDQIFSNNGRYIAYVVEDQNDRFFYRYDRNRLETQLVGTDRRSCPCEEPIRFDIANNGYVVYDSWRNIGIPGESRSTDAYLYGRTSR